MENIKHSHLKNILKEMGSVLVAFSGGVDSSFLLKVACDVLGKKAVAATATSPTYPSRELEEAKAIANFIGARHIIIESNELEILEFSKNDYRRCYYCKEELFRKLKGLAKELGLLYVADGTNQDDLEDYRPGREAAKDLSVRSPLLEAGLTKETIRVLSNSLGLPNWNRPSFACLSSRFPYGTEITPEKLRKVAVCEDYLRELGFNQFRVRYHGEIARIEIHKEEIQRFSDKELREKVVEIFKKNGFTYITLDLQGYRTGSMNEAREIK